MPLIAGLAPVAINNNENYYKYYIYVCIYAPVYIYNNLFKVAGLAPDKYNLNRIYNNMLLTQDKKPSQDTGLSQN